MLHKTKIFVYLYNKTKEKLNMKHKANILLSCTSFCTLFSVVAFLAIGQGNNFFARALSDPSDYSIVLSNSSNKITGTDESVEVSQTFKTARNNNVAAKTKGIVSLDNAWGKASENAYFYNTTRIAGILSMNMDFTTAGANPVVSYGVSSNNFDPGISKELVDDTNILFDGENPTFFRIDFPSATDVTSLTIAFACQNPGSDVYYYTIKGSINSSEALTQSIIDDLKVIINNGGSQTEAPITFDGTNASYSIRTSITGSGSISLKAKDLLVDESYYLVDSHDVSFGSPVTQNLSISSDTYGASRTLIGNELSFSSKTSTEKLFELSKQGSAPGSTSDKYALSFNAKFSTEAASYANSKFRLISMVNYSDSGIQCSYGNNLQLEVDSSGHWYLILYLWNGNTSGTIFTVNQSQHISQTEIDRFFSNNGLDFYFIQDGVHFKVYTYDGDNYHLHIDVNSTVTSGINMYNVYSYMKDVPDGTLHISNARIKLNVGTSYVNPTFDAIQLHSGGECQKTIGLSSSESINNTQTFSVNRTQENVISEFTLAIPGLSVNNGGSWTYYWDELARGGIAFDYRVNLKQGSTGGITKSVGLRINCGRNSPTAGEEWKGLILHLGVWTNGGSLKDSGGTSWMTEKAMQLFGTTGLKFRVCWSRTNSENTAGTIALYVYDNNAWRLASALKADANSSGLDQTYNYMASATLWTYVPTGGKISSGRNLVLTTGNTYENFATGSTIPTMVGLI